MDGPSQVNPVTAAAWVTVAARCQGTAHARRAETCQDAIRILHRGDTLIAAVADGAGSAPRGGAGAALAVRTLTGTLARGQTMTLAFEHAADRLHHAATNSGLEPRALATTAIAIVADPVSITVGHIGDGAVVVLTQGSWSPLSWPETGPFAGTTAFLSDDEAAPRITKLDTPVSAICAFTDGLERLVLDFSAKTAPPAFFERMFTPLAAAPTGPNRVLSTALSRYLQAPAVTERTDDDITLLLARRHG